MNKKRAILIASLFLIAFVVGSYLFHISSAKKLAYVRVTNYSRWPGRHDVACLVVILKSDPNKCFHILEFPPDKEAAKTLDNPAFNHTQYSFLFSLDPATDDARKRFRVKEHGGSGTPEGLADYSDLYDAIVAGSKDEGLWEPTNLYYEIKDGDVYEKSSGERLIDYLSQNEKIPALLNNTQYTSSNSNDIHELLNSQNQGASDTTVIGNSFADEPSSSTNNINNSKSSPQTESSEDGAAKHDLSSIPGFYNKKIYKGENKEFLFLYKGGKVEITFEDEPGHMIMYSGTYKVNNTDIFVVYTGGNFHAHKQRDGSLCSENDLIFEQNCSY